MRMKKEKTPVHHNNGLNRYQAIICMISCESQSASEILINQFSEIVEFMMGTISIVIQLKLWLIQSYFDLFLPKQSIESNPGLQTLDIVAGPPQLTNVFFELELWLIVEAQSIIEIFIGFLVLRLATLADRIKCFLHTLRLNLSQFQKYINEERACCSIH